MSDRAYAKIQAQQKTLIGSSPKSSLLQRTCACGQRTLAGAECSKCRSEQSMMLRSQRAFGPHSAPVTGQGNAPAQENGTSFNSAFDRASRFGHDFTRIPIHSMQTLVPHTKLKVNQPGDVYEQEADQVAEQVMRMTDPGPSVADDEDAAKTSLMRKQSTASGANAAGESPDVPPIVHTVLNSSVGQPLDTTTRAFMEPRFGYDFSQVRVHADGQAAEMARSVQARAYTLGRDVVFGAGEYTPETETGKRLLAHELVHVKQQGTANGSLDTRKMNQVLIQREPTRPRAVTGLESIADLESQTQKPFKSQVTVGSLARQEWESLFRRHFTEPDKEENIVESSHARYLYSKIYGWIDAQHFFAHIQFAEEMGLRAATEEGLSIEGKQELVRIFIERDAKMSPSEIYHDFLTHDLVDPADFLHYGENAYIALSTAMDFFLSKQEKDLIKGFNEEQRAKLLLDNAFSAWSYEDLVSNQLGIQFFRFHGKYINSAANPAEVRQRFLDKIAEFFASIEIVNDPKTIKQLARKLPGKERWTAPKMSEAQVRKKFPELFNLGDATYRLRIAVFDKQALAEEEKETIKKTAPSVSGFLNISPYGSQSYALYIGPLPLFKAMVFRYVIGGFHPGLFKGMVIEPQL